MPRSNVVKYDKRSRRERPGQRPDAAPGAAKRNGKKTDPRVRRLFEALKTGAGETISSQALIDAIRKSGLRLDDPRLRETMKALRDAEGAPAAADLDFDRFATVINPNITVTERALQGAMAIPDFDSFCRMLDGLYDEAKTNDGGAVADYIPQLGRVNPEYFGVSVCTVDGQRYSIGDANVEYCLQSTSKPVNYCLALEEHGEEFVHKHIGREPSGQSFNELTLNNRGLPHNPMINAGAIMSTSLVKPQTDASDRFDHVLDTWQRLMGGYRPGFSNATYLSERQTADRNFALGYSMRERGAFPDNTNLVETLEFYFQICSIEVTAESMAVMAGTLANAGVCPTTGDRVFEPGTVQKCLSLMYSCGMYDFSGEWAFAIGLPAKSGVCGAVAVVVPNVLGMIIWSPRLDENGNSVRGVHFARRLVDTFNFHNYDNLVGQTTSKIDPRLPRYKVQSDMIVALCWASSKGDLTAIRRLVALGADLEAGDYDGRTAIHLAASEGHASVVEYFLSQGVEPNPRDRWGGTPLDDAQREGHHNVVSILESNGGQSGAKK